MTIIIEERLVIELGPSWDVVKYDEHPAYKEGIGCLQGSKAVDILGQREGCLYLIEIKDFRRYRIENRSRLSDGDLAVEVASKVRDTLAGLVGSVHARSSETWGAWVKSMLANKPRVLLWLEQDRTEGRELGRGRPRLPLIDTLEKNLRWLCPRVMVVNQDTSRLPDLTVRNLSDRVFALRSLVKGKGRGQCLTLDEYAGALAVTANIAREQTAKLCERGALKRAGAEDRFVPGPLWAELHEEPT